MFNNPWVALIICLLLLVVYEVPAYRCNKRRGQLLKESKGLVRRATINVLAKPLDRPNRYVDGRETPGHGV